MYQLESESVKTLLILRYVDASCNDNCRNTFCARMSVSLVEKLMGKIQSAGKVINSASERRGEKLAVLIATFSQFGADINITQILT